MPYRQKLQVTKFGNARLSHFRVTVNNLIVWAKKLSSPELIGLITSTELQGGTVDTMSIASGRVSCHGRNYSLLYLNPIMQVLVAIIMRV